MRDEHIAAARKKSISLFISSKNIHIVILACLCFAKRFGEREPFKKILHNNKRMSAAVAVMSSPLGANERRASPPINGAALEHFFFSRGALYKTFLSIHLMQK